MSSNPFRKLIHLSMLLLFLLFLPIGILVYCTFWLLSSFIYLIAKIRFGSSVFIPSGFDMVAGSDSEYSRPYFNVILKAQGFQHTVEEIQEYFQKTLTMGPDQKPRPELKKWTHVLQRFAGYGLWVLYPHFNIKDHVRLVPHEELFDGQECPGHLEDYGARMMKLFGSREIEPHPKWEFLLYQEEGGSSIGLFRVHHSITDGLHFIRLLTQRFADKQVEDIKYPDNNYRKRSIAQSILLGLRAICLLPSGLWKLLSLNDRNPLHGEKLSGEKIHLLSKPFSLALVKKIKNRLDVTVNDVIFSCAAKSVSNHFDLRSTRVNTVTSILAVSRPIERGHVQMKNNFLVAPVTLPTASYEEPISKEESNTLEYFYTIEPSSLHSFRALRRLAATKKYLDDVKKDPSLLAIGWVLITASTLLPSFLSKHVISAKGITLDITNLQGPQSEDWKFLGYSIEETAFFLADNDPLGLALAILSFRGKFRVGLTVDQVLMTEQEAQAMLDSLIQEIHTLDEESKQYVELCQKDKPIFKDFIQYAP